MATTSITTAETAIATKWEKKLQSMFEGRLVLNKYADVQNVTRGEAGTITFNRVLEPAKKTTTTNYGTATAAASAKALYTDKVTVTPQKQEDYFGFDDGTDLLAFIAKGDWEKPVMTQMKKSCEAYFHKNITAQQGLRYRADKNTSYQVSGTATGGSTTTLTETTVLAGASNVWQNYFLTITGQGGRNFGITRKVTSSAAGVLTVPAFPQAIASSPASKFWLAGNTGITSATVLTPEIIADVSLAHEILGTPSFGGGFDYVMFLASFAKRDLMNSDTFIQSGINSEPSRFGDYSVMHFYDHEFVIGSELARENTAATLDDAGPVFLSPSFGKGALTIMPWGQGSGDFGVEWHVVDKADRTDLTSNTRFLSWKTHWAGAVLNATHCINVLHGANTAGMNFLVD